MSDSASLPTAPLEVPRDPLVGTVIGDRYRMLARIGEGGMGSVYRAEHVLMKKVLAVKVLHPEMGAVDDAARRFEREAQSASRLNHPNIIAVTDFGRAANGALFLVMEYIDGQSLAGRLEREGPLAVPEAVELTRQILLGLEHAHAQGVVHRDLKPHNIMLARPSDTRAGALPKILDFGIAKMTQADGDRPLTQGAMVFGTPSYMSPEQATAQDVDARADLYSCGVMLYEMLTGRKPFVADDLVKVMAMQVTATPPAFAQVAPERDLPAALEAVVMRALAKDRAQRFQTAAEFREALERAQAASPSVVERLPGLVARLRGAGAQALARLPGPVRRRAPLGAAGAIVLLLAVVPSLCVREAPPPTASPPRPKPVEPELKAKLKKIEEAIGNGQLTEARLLLMQQLSQHPKNGRVRYLLGNLEFAEKNAGAGLAAYAEAVRLDPGLRADAALLFNVQKTIPDRVQGREALDLAIDHVGKPAGAILAEVASDDKRPEFRKAAREACRKLGCLEKVDLVRSHTLDLQQARKCDERREAILALAATKDPRAVEPLRKARRTTGGFLGGFSEYACVRKDLQAALTQLGAEGK